jgi:hypothetical protein
LSFALHSARKNGAAKSMKISERIFFIIFIGGNTSLARLMTNAADGDDASAA